MSLDNLVRTHQLKPYSATPSEVQRLLAAAKRNRADADVAAISDETRFDAAYKAIMQCSMVALLANGYRPSTSTPGHHQTMIQTLPLTLGIARERWLLLDALRRKRNINDYSGDLMDADTVSECLRQADALLMDVQTWLRERHPALLAPIGGTVDPR